MATKKSAKTTKKTPAKKSKATLKTPKVVEPAVASAETPKVRQLKKAETVRERADKATNAKPKRRVVRGAAKTSARPFKAIGRLLAKVFCPFRFLLKPFKTRPARLVGRVLAAVLLLRYIRNSAREVRTVSWPGRRETLRLTLAVFMFAIVFGTVIALTDYGLDKVFKHLLLK